MDADAKNRSPQTGFKVRRFTFVRPTGSPSCVTTAYGSLVPPASIASRFRAARISTRTTRGPEPFFESPARPPPREDPSETASRRPIARPSTSNARDHGSRSSHATTPTGWPKSIVDAGSREPPDESRNPEGRVSNPEASASWRARCAALARSMKSTSVLTFSATPTRRRRAASTRPACAAVSREAYAASAEAFPSISRESAAEAEAVALANAENAPRKKDAIARRARAAGVGGGTGGRTCRLDGWARESVRRFARAARRDAPRGRERDAARRARAERARACAARGGSEPPRRAPRAVEPADDDSISQRRALVC